MTRRAAREKTGTKLPDLEGLPRAVVLAVAGFDPSSGAGITADLETFWNHGLYGVSAITALTVQSSAGVRGMEAVRGELLRRTLECLAADRPMAGIKIGMLATAELVREVGSFLDQVEVERGRVVLDPVLRSSSGAELLDREGVEILRQELLPRVGWVTPNVDELAVLTGAAVPGREQVAELAGRLAAGAGLRAGSGSGSGSGSGVGLNVVVTGGHLDSPDDFLLTAEGEERWFTGQRMEGRAIRSVHGTHGTGCAFSSALLCRLVLGDGPAEAVEGAKAWVVRRLGTGWPG